MTSTSLHNGTMFADRYRIHRRIAIGGMGAVYEVMHTETARRCALKVMHAHYLQDEELRLRFRQEARVAAAIETEHVVNVFDAGVDPSTQMPFMVMELLRGEDLAKWLRKRMRCTEIEAVTYLRQVAGALDKMHQGGVVHRDLKPGNLFLTHREDGGPWIKILDFGIAKVLAEDASRNNATTGVGTPLYMAPEQFRPDLPISPATDLYALGMVTYTLLVGFPYWREESRRSEGNVYLFAREILDGPAESATVRARRAGVNLPDPFEPWFAKATAHDPSRRFLTAGDMILSLAVALGVSPAGLDSMETARTQVLAIPPDPLDLQCRTAPGVVSTAPPSSRPGRRLFLGVAALGMTALGATGAILLTRAPAVTAQAGSSEGSTAGEGLPPDPSSAAEAPPAAPPPPPSVEAPTSPSVTETAAPRSPPRAATAPKPTARQPPEVDSSPARRPAVNDRPAAEAVHSGPPAPPPPPPLEQSAVSSRPPPSRY